MSPPLDWVWAKERLEERRAGREHRRFGNVEHSLGGRLSLCYSARRSARLSGSSSTCHLSPLVFTGRSRNVFSNLFFFPAL